MGSMRRKRGNNFALLTQDERNDMARRGGEAAAALGKLHQFTRRESRLGALKRVGRNELEFKMRRHNGRYEYLVPDANGGRWVSRQRVHQLRRKGKL